MVLKQSKKINKTSKLHFSVNLSFIIRYVSAFLGDALILVLISILTRKNKKMRQMSNSNHVPLCQKYQLVENIRILKFFKGSSIITLVFGMGGYILSIFRFGYDRADLSIVFGNVVTSL